MVTFMEKQLNDINLMEAVKVEGNGNGVFFWDNPTSYLNPFRMPMIAGSRYSYILHQLQLREHISNNYKTRNNSICIAVNIKSLMDGVSNSTSTNIVFDKGGSSKQFIPKEKGKEFLPLEKLIKQFSQKLYLV